MSYYRISDFGTSDKLRHYPPPMSYSPRHKVLRSLLREVRQEAGLLQRELSKTLGKAETYVSKLEIGERRIDYIETCEFCEACKTTIEDFSQRFTEATKKLPSNSRKKRKSPRRGE